MPTVYLRDRDGRRKPIAVSRERYSKLTGIPGFLGGSMLEKFGMELGNAVLQQRVRDHLLQLQVQEQLEKETPKKKKRKLQKRDDF